MGVPSRHLGPVNPIRLHLHRQACSSSQLFATPPGLRRRFEAYFSRRYPSRQMVKACERSTARAASSLGVAAAQQSSQCDAPNPGRSTRGTIPGPRFSVNIVEWLARKGEGLPKLAKRGSRITICLPFHCGCMGALQVAVVRYISVRIFIRGTRTKYRSI